MITKLLVAFAALANCTNAKHEQINVNFVANCIGDACKIEKLKPNGIVSKVITNDEAIV